MGEPPKSAGGRGLVLKAERRHWRLPRFPVKLCKQPSAPRGDHRTRISPAHWIPHKEQEPIRLKGHREVHVLSGKPGRFALGCDALEELSLAVDQCRDPSVRSACKLASSSS